MNRTTGTAGDRLVACPTCKRDSVFSPGNRFRPFCSERCANVDFGAWASEAYRVAAKPDEGADQHRSQRE